MKTGLIRVGEDWKVKVDETRAWLGAPRNPDLFPPHFLKVVFPKLGGEIIEITKQGELIGVGFLFPRALNSQGEKVYTLRLQTNAYTNSDLALRMSELIESELGLHIGGIYQPEFIDEDSYSCTRHCCFQGINYGTATCAEAREARELQRVIWGIRDDDYLYPADLYSSRAHSGTALVACQNQVSGFLFGFLRFGGPQVPEELAVILQTKLRLESQVMGVLPTSRGKGLGFNLKKLQADLARSQHEVDLIHWTVDPLQFANACLNFGKLGAVAFSFHPNYYPFQNELNQLPASRLIITWPVGLNSVQARLQTSLRSMHDITGQAEYYLVEEGAWLDCLEPNRIKQDLVAIEIPASWTRMQQGSLKMAWVWRNGTDQVFGKIMGIEPEMFVINGVGSDPVREKRYLVGMRVQNYLEDVKR